MEESSALRILLVDDEDMLVRLGTRVLERLGHQVDGRCDPVEALESVQSDPDSYDVVITDLTMPGLSGLELATKIGEHAPDLPVVLVTGFGDISHEAFPSAIQRTLNKPFTVDQLKNVLEGFVPRA